MNPLSKLNYCRCLTTAKAVCGILCCILGAVGCSTPGGAIAENKDSGATQPTGSGGNIGSGGTTASLPAATGGSPGSGGATANATGGNPTSTSAEGGAVATGGAIVTETGGTTPGSGGALGTGGRSGTGGNSATGGTTTADAGRTGGTTTISIGTGGTSTATGGSGGTTSSGGSGGVLGSGGTTGAGGTTGTAPINSVCPNCIPLFDGTSLSGWTQVPANSWSVVAGAMHSLGTARGFVYTNKTYGDFRFIFTSRLVTDPANHLPCVLFFGNSPAKDALTAIQVQPPKGYMWDYRTTGPTANKSPDMYETRYGGAPASITLWAQCEMLGNVAAGTMRFACCQQTGTTPCKATEIVLFKDPTAGMIAPLAFQVHNAGMIEEFKDVYIESPVADPTTLLTTK